MVSLGGRAKELLLLPASLDKHVALDILSTARTELLITDQPTSLPAIAIPTYESIEAANSDASLGIACQPGAAVAPIETDWLLATSGTTARPKLVKHSFASLTRTTKTSSTQGIERVWGLLYDHARFAGIQVVLQALLSGTKLLVAPQHEPLNKQIDYFARQGCNCLSATPSLWRKILMCPSHKSLPLLQITLGGEAADGAILSALKNTYPTARIAHIYASTEAGVGFSVVDGLPGFPIQYLQCGPAGIQLKISKGRLFIRAPQMHSSYVNSDKMPIDEDGFIDTGDEVIEQKGRVNFLGRSSGVINVGGDKVHPEYVENVLNSHPQVALSRVFAKANPILGNLVCAEVALKTTPLDLASLKKEMIAFCRKKLKPYQVPATIKFVETLTVNETGKIQRNS